MGMLLRRHHESNGGEAPRPAPMVDEAQAGEAVKAEKAEPKKAKTKKK